MAFIGLYYQDWFTFLTPLYGFVMITILELIFPVDTVNISEEEANNRLKKKIFDWLLYLNLPIVYSLVGLSLVVVTMTRLETYEFIGLIISVGIVFGVNGINVAHELGHRQTTNERFIGKALMLPALYMHF